MLPTNTATRSSRCPTQPHDARNLQSSHLPSSTHVLFSVGRWHVWIKKERWKCFRNIVSSMSSALTALSQPKTSPGSHDKVKGRRKTERCRSNQCAKQGSRIGKVAANSESAARNAHTQPFQQRPPATLAWLNSQGTASTGRCGFMLCSFSNTPRR